MISNPERIPVFLRYPDDPVSEEMFGRSMVQVRHEKCGYRFMLYTGTAWPVPAVETQAPPFEINETHYYFRAGFPSWYTVCTMKDASVARNTVRNWVESGDSFAAMAGATDLVLRTPFTMRNRAYQKAALYDMEEWPDYNQLHGFDESHVYSHVFYLDHQLYKKFILVAKKWDCSWRVEVNILSEHEQIMLPDFVPAGQAFGSFYPLR